MFNYQKLAFEWGGFLILYFFNASILPFAYNKLLRYVFKVNIIKSDYFNKLNTQIKDLEEELDEKFKKYLYLRYLDVGGYGYFKKINIQMKKFFLEKIIVDLSTDLSKIKSVQDTLENVYNKSVEKSGDLHIEDGENIFESERYLEGYVDNFKKFIEDGGNNSDDSEDEKEDTKDINIIELVIED